MTENQLEEVRKHAENRLRVGDALAAHTLLLMESLKVRIAECERLSAKLAAESQRVAELENKVAELTPVVGAISENRDARGEQ